MWSTAMTETTSQISLAGINVHWLRRALDLLDRIDDVAFATPPKGWEPCRVSSQLRHVIEFYECFLEGLASSHVDYDARRRDVSIEASREAAAARIRRLIERLESNAGLSSENVLFVRAEDADGLGLADPFVLSSVARELLALSSHTVHHFALIAMTLRAHGVAVDPDFGVAPSTIRHRERARQALAQEAA